MKRFAAFAIALCASFPASAHAAPLQRLTVTSFTLTADTAKPELETPFHLIVSLHVRETVPEIDNINLPVLVDVELLGDARMTQAGPNGTDYRETITVVAHHTGKITLAPATLQAIDAKDGKAKQYSTNALTLEVTGAALAVPGPESQTIQETLASIWAMFRSFVVWIVGLGALVVLVVLLARRRPAAVPAAVAASPPPPPRPVVPARSRRERLQDALTVLRADRNRPTAVRVRAVVWELIGASDGETLADVLRRPEAADPLMAGVLRALERAAFTYDDDLAPAIDAACEALERYLA
ncbi:MAG TPA: hypothetical protein VK760_04165 [Candidatus Acidoferrales bacterium]|jgi:hypothetical protein|nr:hypothetical protein [Candidatus Acidoferrales bacterium]